MKALGKVCINRSNAHERKSFSKKSIFREPFVDIFHQERTLTKDTGKTKSQGLESLHVFILMQSAEVLGQLRLCL